MPALPPTLEGVDHRDVEAGGVRFHVAEAGEGPPIVLLHGWPQHWWVWRKLIPDLARDHRVICPDMRGFGWSDAPAGDYAKETLAEDLVAILDALELDRVRLVGHDWGGFASFLACLLAPERFEGLVAMNIVHPWFKPPKPTPKAVALASYQFVLATPGLGERTLRNTPLVKTIIRRGSHPGHTWTDAELSTYADVFKDPAHAKASSALYRTFLRRELGQLSKGYYDDRRLTVPTVLLTGSADPVVTPERIATLPAHADDARVEVIPDCGHFSAEEQPEKVLAIVRAHLG
ncbi:MAG: alpha/beta hydrolase [Thermoleophilaceae bacterium]|nr:alpha/beta hydrolase [Thermoleophilaceae bacterium]